jgi:hypothetical protein
MEIERRAYPVKVYTATHEVRGIHTPIGNLLTAINNEGVCFEMTDVTYTPLAPNAVLRPISVPQAVLHQDEILFIAFEEEGIAEDLTMLKRVDRLIIYTASFVLRGEMHLGAEDQIRDMLDTIRGRFQPLTEATIFPVVETQVRVSPDCDLVLLNTTSIQFYHPENAE